jgi:hypothetical protein
VILLESAKERKEGRKEDGIDRKKQENFYFLFHWFVGFNVFLSILVC